MKKFLVAVLALAMIAGTVPAHADNSEEVIIGVLGGALGGLIIGSALNQPRVVYREVAPVYPVYDEYVEPAPVRCVYKNKRVYSPEYDTYVTVKKRVCYR